MRMHGPFKWREKNFLRTSGGNFKAPCPLNFQNFLMTLLEFCDNSFAKKKNFVIIR
jgi:hypothetical protein